MLCQLCGKQKKLVESHIVPRSWHAPLKSSSAPIIILYKNPDAYPKASQTGEYDTEILCADCDSSFSLWEAYTRNLLFQDLNTETIQRDSTGQRRYVIPEYDYAATKLCLLSILWRMSISKRQSFTDVQLGPFESQIKEMILRKDPGEPTKFTTSILRYEDDVGSATMIGTRMERHHDRNVYTMGLPGFISVIKVDHQPIPIHLGGELVLRPNSPLIIGLRRMDKGNEWGFLTKILKNDLNRQSKRAM
jgi:hypothetical protein